jgi:hypothetical protein
MPVSKRRSGRRNSSKSSLAAPGWALGASEDVDLVLGRQGAVSGELGRALDVGLGAGVIAAREIDTGPKGISLRALGMGRDRAIQFGERLIRLAAAPLRLDGLQRLAFARAACAASKAAALFGSSRCASAASAAERSVSPVSL